MANAIVPVALPALGEGIQEATVVKWLKKTGQWVEKDEPLVEISTDKVDTEIASPGEGYLIAILSPEGQTVRIDQLIAVLAPAADMSVPPELVEQPSTREAKNPSPTPTRGIALPRPSPAMGSNASGRSPTEFRYERPRTGQYLGWVRASPLVRALAKEHQIPLTDLVGSGLHGRLTKDDVYAYLEAHQSSGEATARHQAAREDQPLATYWHNEQEYLDGTPIVREKMSTMRRLIAEHMRRSVRRSPHVTTTFEIDLMQVKQAREVWQKSFTAAHGFPLSYTPFFIAAAAAALAEYPEINSAIDGEEILWRKDINIGCAVATERGLIVPVLKGLAGLGLEEIAVNLGRLVEKARTNKLLPEDVHGGTFSVTNPGMFGSLHSQPIINQPQVAILSVGAILEKPVVVKGEILVHPLVQVGLTFDHRLVDGEGGAKFLSHVKRVLENFAATR